MWLRHLLPLNLAQIYNWWQASIYTIRVIVMIITIRAVCEWCSLLVTDTDMANLRSLLNVLKSCHHHHALQILVIFDTICRTIFHFFFQVVV